MLISTEGCSFHSDKSKTDKMEMSEIQGDSVHVEYYENGKVKIVKENKRYGAYNFFYENGNIAETGRMIDNRKTNIWRYFDRDGVLKEVKIFGMDSLLFDMDPVDFVLSTKNVEGESFEIDVPAAWNTTTEHEDPVVMWTEKVCNDHFSPTITVTKQKISIEKSTGFSDFVNSNFQLLQKEIPYFKPVAQESLIINDLQAFHLIYFFINDGVQMGGVTTWIYYGDGYVYIVTGTSINESRGEFFKYKDLFVEVASSFRKSRHILKKFSIKL
jgi:hypothetical protein